MVTLPQKVEGYNKMGYFTSPCRGRLWFTKNEGIILKAFHLQPKRFTYQQNLQEYKPKTHNRIHPTISTNKTCIKN